uniref:Secreted protein n=1 Tax=Ascaris lumbricoides TaxID=6252 RepID=A0A0M3IRZ8_ASCLU
MALLLVATGTAAVSIVPPLASTSIIVWLLRSAGSAPIVNNDEFGTVLRNDPGPPGTYSDD